MATGPEHYKRADEMMQALAKAADEGVDLPVAHAQTLLAQAQVHATLALAAAMGTFGVAEETRTAADVNAWEWAAGEDAAQRRIERQEAEEWHSHDVSDVMQTVEIHTAPAPGDIVADEDGGPF